MKTLKLGLVIGLAVLLVTVFALPGPEAAEKKVWRCRCKTGWKGLRRVHKYDH